MSSVVRKISLNVVNAFEEPLPKLLIHRFGGEFVDFLGEQLAERVCIHLIESEANDGELPGQKSFAGQIDEGGQELAFSEVAAGAENDHGARRSRLGGLSRQLIRDSHIHSMIAASMEAPEYSDARQPLMIFSRRGRQTGSAWRRGPWRQIRLHHGK